MASARLAFGIITFMLFFSVILSSITGQAFTLLSPTTFTIVMSVEITAVIATSGTIAKGVSMAAFFATLIGYILIANMPFWTYGVIIFPLFVGLALALADTG